MSLKKSGIYEKIINVILDILIFIFGIFLLISIYNNVQVKILGNEYSSFFGYSTFEVQTGSMADTINPGDWIIVKITKNVKLNDIITYSHKEDFITHRIVEVYKDSFITKGDANSGKDDIINKSQVVGKVVKILPYFGIIRKTFFNPLVLIALILTLYSISYVLRSSRNNNVTNKNKLNYKEKIDAFVNYILTKLLDYIKKKLKNNTDIEQNEIENNIPNEEELQIILPEIDREQMDKTLYFRTISVDKTDLDNIETTGKNEKDEELIQDSSNQNFEKSEIEEKVNLIQGKRKKFKNIVAKSMFFKKDEINQIIEILLQEENSKTNESSIKEEILDAYIDGKYYNHCGDINVQFSKKNVFSKIEQEIEKIGDDLISKYKGSDNKYNEKVSKYVRIFKLINYLEKIDASTTELNEKRDLYRDKILKILKPESISAYELKNMINKIIKTQKIYRSMIDFILEKANTNAFKLTLNKISGNKNMFFVDVAHNITFSKVYSEYIVDKTYTEGIIAEDKVIVLLNLLLINIVKDMLDLEENKKYFIIIPDSVYLKSNKLDKIFKIFEDEYAKNNIIVVVGYNELSNYNSQINKLRKKGYQFAIILNNEMEVKENKYIEMVEYLIVNKKIMTYSLISSIPDDLAKKIIINDVVNKSSNLGGE